MTLIPIDFTNVSEATAVSAGRYNLQITECKSAVAGPNAKTPGAPQLIVNLAFTDQELNAPDIRQYISLPSEFDEDARSSNFKALLLKRFLVAFNVRFDQSGIDTEQVAMDMVGCDATLEVTQAEPDANGNVYNRIIVPKLRDEGGRR